MIRVAFMVCDWEYNHLGHRVIQVEDPSLIGSNALEWHQLCCNQFKAMGFEYGDFRTGIAVVDSDEIDIGEFIRGMKEAAQTRQVGHSETWVDSEGKELSIITPKI